MSPMRSSIRSAPDHSETMPTWLIGPAGLRSPSGNPDLERALVAGILLEVLLDGSKLPEDPQSRRRRVKCRLKDVLVSRLAGHIPLNSFLNLAQKLDLWFDTYYPLISPADLKPQPCSIPTRSPASLPEGILAEEGLSSFLDEIDELLPHRRHRKLSREGLQEFLGRTKGEWFRLKDFQEFFRLERKTAWEYVQKLAGAGLFCRNQGRSSSVRYRLESHFLRLPEGKT